MVAVKGQYTYEYPRPSVTTDCVIFGYDGKDIKVLLVQRGIEPFKGMWAFPGGFLQMDESAIDGAKRELQEETGIVAKPEEFELLDTCTERGTHYDHYCLHRDSAKVKVVLQPGETDGVQWATFDQVHEMIREHRICKAIGKQFLRHEPMLLARQSVQE